MSFGFSIGDFITLTQLASRVVGDSRKACGAHDELTQEVSSLHTVLQRLKRETENPESPLNRPGDSCQDELQSILAGCEKLLSKLETILTKYNALSQAERSGRKLWLRIRFGNGEMQDLTEMRAKLVYYTSALSLFLNMVSIGSTGRIEKQMEEAGGDLRKIKLAVNGITAHLLAGSKREGSVLTAYANDDKAVWKEFRRELVSEGFSSATIQKHKDLIKAYVKELASRGLLDEQDTYGEENEETYDSYDAVEDSLPIPSYGTVVHIDGVGWEFEPLILNQDSLCDSKCESCKALEAGQTNEGIPRPVLTSPIRNESIRCVRCLSDILKVRIVVLSCDHRMCLGCLRQLFELSVVDPQYMPPRCCTEDPIRFEYVDKVFNERFQVQWAQEYEKYLKRIHSPYDVDEQLPLYMPKDAEDSLTIYHWDAPTEFPSVFFVVSPYGIYLVAFGYNVSVLLCRFRHWFGVMQRCTSEPRVARSWQDSGVFQDTMNLNAVGVEIASTIGTGTSHTVDPVSVHWNLLNILVQHDFSVERWGKERKILHDINDWVRDCDESGPALIFGVQQCMYLEDNANVKQELEDFAFRYEFKRGKECSLALNPELSRDKIVFSAPIMSRTSDDGKDLILDSITMAQAIWERVDRLELFYSSEERLRHLLSYYQDEIEPRCVNYLVGPPGDAKTKEQALKLLQKWVKTDFLDKVDCLKGHKDFALTYMTNIRVHEAKWLLKGLKGGTSSAKDSSGGISQKPLEDTTK